MIMSPKWWAGASGKPQRYMHFEGSPESFKVFVGKRISGVLVYREMPS